MTLEELGLLTVKDAAKLAGVTEGRIRQLLNPKFGKPQLTGEKAGHVWLVHRASVLRFAREVAKTGRPRSRKGV